MVKKIMRTDTYHIDESLFEGEIDNVIKSLVKLKVELGGDAVISVTWNWEDTDWVIHYKREETDKEQEQRIRASKRQRERRKREKISQEEAERNEYERLKEKFE